MDDNERKKIIDNINSLIRLTNYKMLLDACEKASLISSVMKWNIVDLQCSNEDKHRELFKKITKRGPTAFERFVAILDELKYDDAKMLLTNKKIVSIREQKNYIKNNSLRKSENFIKLQKISYLPNPKFNQNLKTIKKSTKISSDSKVGVYPMQTRNRGVFFMVNIIDYENRDDKRRNGAEYDTESLLHLFHELGFHLYANTNMSKESFYEFLDQLMKTEEINSAECFVMALMTHGEMFDKLTDKVQFSDGAVESVSNILDRFQNGTCPKLAEIPKIFLFPFCRGPVADKGVYPITSVTQITMGLSNIENDSILSHSPIIQQKPTCSDMLLCYATVPGFKAHRDPANGSWYIQTLYNIFADYAHDTHIEDMLKMISNKAGKLRTVNCTLQTPSYSNHGFNKKLFFNPGYYPESR